MKKFLRAFGVITIFVVTLPLQAILVMINFVLALYYEIAFGVSIVTYFKVYNANTISEIKMLVHWVKTGEFD